MIPCHLQPLRKMRRRSWRKGDGRWISPPHMNLNSPFSSHCFFFCFFFGLKDVVIVKKGHPAHTHWLNTLPSRKLTYPPKNAIFEDYFPFPKVGYVNSLEGKHITFFSPTSFIVLRIPWLVVPAQPLQATGHGPDGDVEEAPRSSFLEMANECFRKKWVVFYITCI